MTTTLAAFLARHTPLAVEEAVWGSRDSPVHLRITGYLGADWPPLDLITSVRCVVFRAGDDEAGREPAVLLGHNVDGTCGIPGGRQEPGETLDQTLARELLEESGWTLRDPAPLGFLHFLNRSPKPPGSPYPYPDFAQVIYTATAATYHPGALLPDAYELGARFHPIAEARRYLSPGQFLYIDAALKARTR